MPAAEIEQAKFLLSGLLEHDRLRIKEYGATTTTTASSDEAAQNSSATSMNTRTLGFALEAALRVEPLPGKLRTVEKTLQEMSEIVECSVVTGEDCFVARLVMREIGDLDRLLGPLHDISRTKTSIVHRQPVPPRRAPV